MTEALNQMLAGLIHGKATDGHVSLAVMASLSPIFVRHGARPVNMQECPTCCFTISVERHPQAARIGKASRARESSHGRASGSTGTLWAH